MFQTRPRTFRDIPGAALGSVRQWAWPERIAMAAFLFWVMCGLAFAPFRVLPSDAYKFWWLGGTRWFLSDFVYLCLLWGDVVLIVLAAMNTHFAAVRQWGRADAVRWGVIVMVISGVLETVGTLTGYPFGHYVYTSAFGPRIMGILPITIPLAWLVVMTNFLIMVRQVIPYAPGQTEASSVAVLATMFDIILEPFAFYIKGYWLWLAPASSSALSSSSSSVVPGAGIYPPIPWTNYVAWWSIAFVLVLLAAPRVALRWGDTEPRPVLIIAGMLAIFGVTRLAHGI